MPDVPSDQISLDELRALQVLHQLKSDADRCGHQFAGRMIIPSGTRYLVATDEPDNIAAWIFQQEDRGMSSGPAARAIPPDAGFLQAGLLRLWRFLRELPLQKPTDDPHAGQQLTQG